MELTQVTSSLEHSIDESIEEAAESNPGEPIKVRVQPQVWIRRQNYRTGMFLSWRGVYWNISCTGIEEARSLREALMRFFTGLRVIGISETKNLLDRAIAAAVESATSAAPAADQT